MCMLLCAGCERQPDVHCNSGAVGWDSGGLLEDDLGATGQRHHHGHWSRRTGHRKSPQSSPSQKYSQTRDLFVISWGWGPNDVLLQIYHPFQFNSNLFKIIHLRRDYSRIWAEHKLFSLDIQAGVTCIGVSWIGGLVGSHCNSCPKTFISSYPSRDYFLCNFMRLCPSGIQRPLYIFQQVPFALGFHEAKDQMYYCIYIKQQILSYFTRLKVFNKTAWAGR